MQITIGEITDIILPYTNSIEIAQYHGRPYVTARMSNSDHLCCFIMYITQTAPHVYAMADGYHDTAGMRYIPDVSIEHPLIAERDMARRLYGTGSWEPFTDVRTNVGVDEFVSYLIDCLSSYRLIRYNVNRKDELVNGADIRSTRIKRAIEKAFKDHGYHIGTIGDLVELTMVKKKTIQFKGLKSKEMKTIVTRLKTFGLSCSIEDDFITAVEFDRR
ncbi:MAG: hypothetical protein K2N48_07340 [Muribaculaceae bacterium]|nr:hypothetical protein [Muribaculaceae bacterium]